MTVAGGHREDWDTHVLLLYRDEAHRRASVASWVKKGLDRGEKILYATAPDDDALVPGGLSPGGVQGAGTISDSQISILSVEDFFPPAGQAMLVQQALEEGYAGGRFVARANAAISHLGLDVYRRADHLLDELCSTLPVSALCQYDAKSSPAATTTAMIDSHPDALQDLQLRLRHRGDRVLLSGEVDVGSAYVLEHALQRIGEIEGASEVTLDLSGLSFVDVVGCRALASGTDMLRRAGGVASFQGVNAHMRKVMALLGMDRLPGVQLR